MATSGESDYFLSVSDCLLESFDRLEIRPSAITSEHMISARRSINLELAGWGNNVPLLWKIDSTPTMIPLQQGVSVYNIPNDTVTMLDTYIRTFQLPTQFNVPPAFTVVAGSTSVTAVIANNAMQPGYWFQLTIPIAIGGIVLFGFYEVVSTINANTFTFIVPVVPSSSLTLGGSPPTFLTSVGSTEVQVSLANHGYSAGQSFDIAAQTSVGGILLIGTYTIVSVTDLNNFLIQTYSVASSNAIAIENGNQVQVQAQSANVDPIDRIITPIGRTDYAEFPDKFRQTIPTQYLFLRNVNPTVTLYQVPDGNGPYVLMTYLMRRIQNANPGMGETPDVHFLFLDALCARVAKRLAVKYAKPMLPVLTQDAKEAWDAAITENRERAEDYIMPVFDTYYRI